jgi:moderate conductance mechanosensitive channel
MASRYRQVWSYLSFLVVLLFAVRPAWSAVRPTPAPSASTGLSPTQARQALEVLNDPKKRAEVIQTLQAIAKALPQPTPAIQAAIKLKRNSLGAALIAQLSHGFQQLGEEARQLIDGVATVPPVWPSLSRLADNTARLVILLHIIGKVLLLFGCALIFEWLTGRALTRALTALEWGARLKAPGVADGVSRNGDDAVADRNQAAAARNRTLLQRLPYALGRLLLELLPVAAFTATALILMAAVIGWERTSAQIIRQFATAYIICRSLMCLVRFLLSPAHGELRVIHVDGATARGLAFWLRAITVAAAFGAATAGSARLLGLSEVDYEALLKLVALAVDVLLITAVIRYRRPIARRIAASKETTGTLAMIRNGMSRSWHFIAVLLIAGSWLVGALGIKDGYARLLRFFFLTAAVLIGARLIWIAAAGAIDRAFGRADQQRRSTLGMRVGRYYPLARETAFALIATVAMLVLLQVWGVGVTTWLRGRVGAGLISAATDIGIAVLVAIFIWEGANAAMDVRVSRAVNAGQYANAARLRTLFPMLRTILLGVVLATVGLTVLSAIGVNTGPLLAGAGIVGIAVGFGSQKLVQDFITGIFLLLENEMQIGDWVSVAGVSGSVEDLSIRTLRLRAGDGSVHIIPFSSVTTLTNTNRGIGNAAVSVTVSYREDTDRVGEALKRIAAEMRADPEFKPMMLGDLELWGVDQVQGALVTITGQIRCTDTGRWGVQREFNRRFKKRFEEVGIELANPTQTVMLKRAERKGAGDDRSWSDGANHSGPGPTSASTPQSPPPSALGHDK